MAGIVSELTKKQPNQLLDSAVTRFVDLLQAFECCVGIAEPAYTMAIFTAGTYRFSTFASNSRMASFALSRSLPEHAHSRVIRGRSALYSFRSPSAESSERRHPPLRLGPQPNETWGTSGLPASP
jgi:hypothetical protein